MSKRQNAAALRSEEEKLKDAFYRELVKQISESKNREDAESKYVDRGSFEDQDAAPHYSKLTLLKEHSATLNSLYRSLFQNPYFAHIDIQEEYTNSKMTVMLSDSEVLETPIDFGNDCIVVPFKQSVEAPMLSALFHCYTARDPNRFDVKGEPFVPTLIRQVEIQNRTVRSVTQYFPQLDEQAMDYDELLASILRNNKGSARLQNIIATLQAKQFEIISTELQTDFVVQGCAGSGKTQCLIHRLFFLRDALSDQGWQKVLLITPSKLFRSYSMELMRRYHLDGVRNESLASFYCDLLSDYDKRFTNRQYHFELTEEYLPDEYLQKIYAPEEITRISSEIGKAIHKYVEDACNLLEQNPPAVINADEIAQLLERIGAAITDYDNTKGLLADNDEYQQHRTELASLEKRQEEIQKKTLKEEETLRSLHQLMEQYNALHQRYDEACNELAAWQTEIQREIAALEDRVEQALALLDAEDTPSFASVFRFTNAQFDLADHSRPEGKTYQQNLSYEELLKEIVREAENRIREFCGKRTDRAWRDHQNKRQSEVQLRLSENKRELEDIEFQIELHEEWLTSFAEEGEGIRLRRGEYRESLERSRYFLSRIESAVFEREVWNALAPLKEQHGIRTLDIETDNEGHQKQSRILYKSDLLFYLMIYAELHPEVILSDFQLICIDEGQDLHVADYQMLRRLFPQAVFNIFGDTAQVLHEACGISDWVTQTGVQTVYDIHTNYRNTPAIVDFCTSRFGAVMDGIGRIINEEQPILIERPDELQYTLHSNPGLTVIVKDHAAFLRFCDKANMNESACEFLDTNADRETPGKRHCYSVFAAKGLEFPEVLVFSDEMTKNQRIVSCTRATEKLYYYERRDI